MEWWAEGGTSTFIFRLKGCSKRRCMDPAQVQVGGRRKGSRRIASGRQQGWRQQWRVACRRLVGRSLRLCIGVKLRSHAGLVKWWVSGVAVCVLLRQSPLKRVVQGQKLCTLMSLTGRRMSGELKCMRGLLFGWA